MPRKDAVNLTAAHGVEHRLVLRARGPGNADVVVHEHRDDLPAEPFGEVAGVRFLSLDTGPGALAVTRMRA